MFAPVLTKLQANAVAHFGIAPLRLVPVAYEERPASHLLRLRVYRNGNDTPMSHLFVKVFKAKPIEGGLEAMRQRVARDYDTTRRVYESMLSYSDVGAVPPVACYPELLAIVTEEVKGPTLLQHFEAKAAWFPTGRGLEQLLEITKTAGRWIRVFQSTGPAGGYLTIDQLRAYIDHRLQRLVRESGNRFTEHDRERLLRHVELLGRHIPAEELREVPVHADLALGNILVSGRRIVVLDFAMAQLGSSLHDLARLFLQIDLLSVKPQLRVGIIRQLQRALFAGYDPSLTMDRPLFRLCMLLHRVNNLTTLTVNRVGFAEDLYNRLVRRQHRRWIAHELGRREAMERT